MARSPKCRGGKLRLPISVNLMKMKMRQLVLTSMRLLCMKQKAGGQVSLKSEIGLGLRAGKECEKLKEGKEMERDSRHSHGRTKCNREHKAERGARVCYLDRSRSIIMRSDILVDCPLGCSGRYHPCHRWRPVSLQFCIMIIVLRRQKKRFFRSMMAMSPNCHHS